MERVQLQFWNALTFFLSLLALLFGIAAVVDYSGHFSARFNILLAAIADFHIPRLFLVESNIWLVPAIAALVLAVIIRMSRRWRCLWQQSDFQVIPAPNGGYLRKAGLHQFKQELHQAKAQARRKAKHYFRVAEDHFANNLYQAAAAAYQNSAFAFPTMSAYLNLGISLCYRSSFQKALEAFSTGLSIAKRAKSKKVISIFLCNTFVPHRERGNLTEALSCFKQTYGICGKIQDSAGEACSHGNLGSLFLVQGRPDEALKPWRNALRIFEKINYQLALASAFDGIGLVYSARGDYKAALEHHWKSYKIFKKIHNIPGMTQSLANVGYSYLRLGKLRRSLRVNRQALKLAGRLNSFLDRARIHGNIGRIHQKKGKLEDALKSAEKAYDLYEHIDNPVGMGTELLTMGLIYAAQQKRGAALKKLGEARAKLLQSGVMNDTIEAAIEMASRTSLPAPPSSSKNKHLIQSLLVKILPSA